MTITSLRVYNTNSMHIKLNLLLLYYQYTFTFDTDVAVIVVFFLDGHAVWGAISLAFVALSTFAMQIFSFCWHVTDGSMTVKNFLIHAFFLAPLHR